MAGTTPQLGDLITRLRTQRGLSLRQLASAAGVNVANVSRLESSEASQPSPQTLVRLAEALETDASQLLTAAGYTAAQADALPSFKPYLRAKYGHLPAAARQELSEYLQRLETEYGGKPKRSRSTAKKKNT